MTKLEGWLGSLFAASMTIAAWLHWLPYSLTETLGFVTGTACVYLVIKQSIWNFPLGIANNLFFLVLFLQARLFGDAALQIVYVGLGVQGWHYWLHGGKEQAPLPLARATPRTLGWVSLAIAGATVALIALLRALKGAAPVLDSFTTILSLAAQYLLNRKLLENWYLWILADVLYIYLYLVRGLQLTALLYAIFLGMCLAGWWQWRRQLDAPAELAHG